MPFSCKKTNLVVTYLKVIFMSINSLKKNLIKEYKYKIELHAHSKPVSPCSDIPPEDLVALHKKLGYDAFVLTNHFMIFSQEQDKNTFLNNYIEGYEKTFELGEKSGIKVYLGAEIRFTENNNDYLIYGVNKEILSEIYDYLPYGIENFRKKFPMENSVFIQAHPFRNGIERVNPQLLDGLEVFNMHPGHNSRVGVASRYAKENGLSLITVGTDYHHYGHEGLSALRTKTLPKDSFKLAEILKKQDYIFEIADNNIVLP